MLGSAKNSDWSLTRGGRGRRRSRHTEQKKARRARRGGMKEDGVQDPLQFPEPNDEVRDDAIS